MRRSVRACTLLLLLAGWSTLLVTRTATAQNRHRIVVLSSPNGQDASTAELRVRLRGELTALGLDVSVVAAPEGVDIRDAVESTALELSPSAVIGVREVSAASAGSPTIEVWISDRLSGRTLVERARPGDTPSTQTNRLAVEVSEVFKARIGSMRLESSQADSQPAADAARTARDAELLAGAGLGLIHQWTDPVSAWFPTLQAGVRFNVNDWLAWGTRATVSFTPSSNEFSLAGARAQANQGWGFAQGLLCLAPTDPLELTFSLGGGVYSVGVKGEAELPEVARDQRTWSAAAIFGIGLWIKTNDALIVAFEAQGVSPWSKTVIRIRDEDVASFGFPAGIFSASLVGRY